MDDTTAMGLKTKEEIGAKPGSSHLLQPQNYSIIACFLVASMDNCRYSRKPAKTAGAIPIC